MAKVTHYFTHYMPEWVKHNRCLWREEDDHRPPDHVTADMKWLELFGERLDRCKAIAEHDQGDALWLLFPKGRVLCGSYDGQSIHMSEV